MLVSNLTEIAKRSAIKASEALLETAEDVYDLSQQFVPVDTGALKKSGGTEIVALNEDGRATAVLVGYGAGLPLYDGDQSYANAQEYGTSIMAAQPYLTPAFTQSTETFKARLLAKMEESVK
jgi:HK97 gp10 family phage protein